VSVESQIDITNFKPEAIDMEVNKMVAGTLGRSSVKWDYETRITQDNNPQNQVGSLMWLLEKQLQSFTATNT
jgi:hypothetical protein